jgi:cephalosporin-C deacetylase-like acetyl esterase
MEVGRYFDVINFASRIKAPALIGLGLIDTTCPPGGILAAANQIPGEKEVIVLVDAEHQNKANAHDPYYKRYGIWSSFISRGEKPPAP